MLWTLQIIIVIAILACIAECLHLSLRWYGAPKDATRANWTGGFMRLPGSENLLLEISASDVKESEKTAMPILIVQAPNGDRVCISYEEDDDDEMNRPVM